MLPADFLEVRFTFGEGDDDRTIELRPVGEHWISRADEIAARIGAETSGDTSC